MKSLTFSRLFGLFIHWLPLPLLLAVAPLSAQISNYQPGAVVVKGDTIRGYVNLQTDARMSANVLFKKTRSNREPTTYLPHQLDGYLTSDPLTTYRPVTHHFVRDNDEADRVMKFGREIFAGSLYSLYRVNRLPDEYRYFSDELTDAVYYLRAHQQDTTYKLEIQERRQYATKYRLVESYKGVLNYELRDWPKSGARIANTRFNDKDLADLLADYHDYRQAGVRLRRYESSKLHRNVLIASVGSMPLAFPSQLDYGSTYLLEAVYEYQNPAKSFPFFFIGLGYVQANYSYEGTDETGVARSYNGYNSLRLLVGGRQELLRTASSFALYAHAAAISGNIRYPDEKQQFDVVLDASGNPVVRPVGETDNTLVYRRALTYRFGLGAQYRRFLFDLSLERVRYSYQIQDFALLARASYQLFGRKP